MSLEDDDFDTKSMSLSESGEAEDEHSLENENSEDEEEEGDEKEPKLKFERISNDLKSILLKDSISCCAVHPKFLCIGSKRGNIYILDHLGNSIALNTTNPKKYIEAHKVAVNQISIDSNGDHIASCSDDGKVYIYSLCDGETALDISLDRQIRSIVIDPNYWKGGLSRRFIIGDENTTMYERNIFSRLKSTVILEGGPISSIKWKDRFVAWSRKGEVRVYDSIERVTISRIPFAWRDTNIQTQMDTNIMSNSTTTLNLNISDQHESLRHECNIFWKDAYTIFIGWGDSVKVCQVKKQEMSKVENEGARPYYVQISTMFTTDFWVVGISSYENQSIVLFGREKDGESSQVLSVQNLDNSRDKDNNNDSRPKLHIVQPFSKNYSVLCTDVLQVKDYQNCSALDYHLESLHDDLLYFIVSPKDVILAKNRDYDDRIQWLIEHKKYDDALEFASTNSKALKKHSFLQIGLAYLDHLMDTKRYTEAGKLCFRVLGPKEHWEKWEEQVLKFGRLGQLRAIAPYLPRSETFKLPPYVYEMVLFDYLKTDQDAFHRLVRDWAPPPNLFNVTTIINAVLDHLVVVDSDNHFLLQALADLYSYQRKYGKALAMYLKLQDPHVFQLIQKYNLFDELTDNVEDLMSLKMDESLALLMKYRDRVSPPQIAQKLQNNRYYLYKYLDSLYTAVGKEMPAEFHVQMVHLYADYGRDNLLQFLRASDHYPMRDAFMICKKRKLYPEMIFLLSRMGNAREALRLITHELQDIQQAIEFCKEHDDKDLWDDLIAFSLDKPDYINLLLCNIGTHVNPEMLIRKIKNGMEIPGLRDSLVKIMQDYSLQVSLQDGCKNIVVNDSLILFQKLVKTQLRGVYVEDDQECGSCHKKIVYKDFDWADDIKVFYCKHVFHDACLSSFDYQNCVICNLPRKAVSFLEKL